MACFRFCLCDVQRSFVRHGTPDFQIPLRHGLDYGLIFYVVCWWFRAFLEGFRTRQRISRSVL